jgi:hypothetical protein
VFISNICDTEIFTFFLHPELKLTANTTVLGSLKTILLKLPCSYIITGNCVPGIHLAKTAKGFTAKYLIALN